MMNAEILAVLMLAMSPILLAFALAVRYAGESRILNVTDYSRVKDRTSLHRWVGNRLLFLPTAAFLCGIFSLCFSSLIIISTGLLIVTFLSVFISIVASGKMF